MTKYPRLSWPATRAVLEDAGVLPRVRSHCRFRKRGTEYASESGMNWTSGGAKRECDRALALPQRVLVELCRQVAKDGVVLREAHVVRELRRVEGDGHVVLEPVVRTDDAVVHERRIRPCPGRKPPFFGG
jgi:hypothetical protein